MRKRFPGIVFADAPELIFVDYVGWFASHNDFVDRSEPGHPPGMRLAERFGWVVHIRYQDYVERG